MAPPQPDPYRLDPVLYRQRGQRSAQTYDRAALIYREQVDRLLEHLDPVRTDPATILDVGSATGHSTRLVAARFARSFVCGIDWAPARLSLARAATPRSFLRKARYGYVGADAHALPFNEASFDVVVATGVPSSTSDPGRLSLELARVLRPGGLFAFAAFGPDTLLEMRACWADIDTDLPQAPTRCHRFLDMHDYGDALQRSGLAGVVMDAEYLTLTYAGFDELLREIRDLGDTNVTASRSAGLTHPGRLERLRKAYDRYRTPDGRLPLTFELIYAHAWRTEQSLRDAPIPIELTRPGGH